MDSLQISSSPFLSLAFFVFFLLIKIPPSLCNYDLYKSCSNRFTCGKIQADYPFWGNSRPADCGHPDLKLDCEKDTATISIMNVKYRVLDINPKSEVLKLARDDYMRSICLKQFLNTTLDSALFDYGAPYQNLTLLYDCAPSNAPIAGKFKCPIGEIDYDWYMEMGTHGPGPCNFSVVVPIGPGIHVIDTASLSRAIREGFEVRWKVRSAEDCRECKISAGVCGFSRNSNQTVCFCQNQPSESRSCNSTPTASVEPPTDAPEAKKKLSITLGPALAGAGLAGIIVGCWIFYCIQQRKNAAAKSKSVALSSTVPSTNGVPAATNFSRSTRSYPSSKSDLEKGSTYFGVHVFSYTELEEATGNFDSSRELGEGGFGTVYYGKLQDGRVVAVKRLYENNFKRVEQFMNEVEILTRLQHENLVKLYGCTSKRSRELLLVYEYIPNGTVADHLHGNRAKSGLVSWPVRLSIAVEAADALAYLHRSDIIHRDVKTNNILLDNNFRVKVADFGLSRLFPTDVTHVSTAPQGTPGYVDPEYYQCYQLTNKSDVYSFGVVLIELISSKQAVDTNRHRHDINLANMAINKIQNHTLHELVDPSLGFEKDNTVRRMTTLVAELAFQCLQQERDMRPSMEEVLKILRGIQSEEVDTQKAEVVDIRVEDVGQLRLLPPQLSPDSVATEKWASDSALPNSF